jgi:hypothetical protein
LFSDTEQQDVILPGVNPRTESWDLQPMPRRGVPHKEI